MTGSLIFGDGFRDINFQGYEEMSCCRFRRRLFWVLSVLPVVLTTVVWTIPVHFFALTKLLVPHEGFQAGNARYVMTMVRGWIAGIILSLKIALKVDGDIKGVEGLRKDEWYFVNSNHQSWTDIIVLLRVFANRIPFPKFFLKRELAWISILGSAWWALDYPFMKRCSKDCLEKHPEKKGKDLETTRIMCERYAHTLVSILNFIEGTRFTKEKRDSKTHRSVISSSQRREASPSPSMLWMGKYESCWT